MAFTALAQTDLCACTQTVLPQSFIEPQVHSGGACTSSSTLRVQSAQGMLVVMQPQTKQQASNSQGVHEDMRKGSFDKYRL